MLGRNFISFYETYTLYAYTYICSIFSDNQRRIATWKAKIYIQTVNVTSSEIGEDIRPPGLQRFAKIDYKSICFLEF